MEAVVDFFSSRKPLVNIPFNSMNTRDMKVFYILLLRIYRLPKFTVFLELELNLSSIDQPYHVVLTYFQVP